MSTIDKCEVCGEGLDDHDGLDYMVSVERKIRGEKIGVVIGETLHSVCCDQKCVDKFEDDLF